MNIWLLSGFLFLSLLSGQVQAQVISPSSIEVKFELVSEFHTQAKSASRKLVLEQAKHLFGYMQNPGIAASFGLNKRIAGIGAPRWEPEFEILYEKNGGGMRTISYRMRGLFLLNKEVATDLLRRREWRIEMPYDLDNFFNAACTDSEHDQKEEFWYFNDVFRRGCEQLRTEPLAKSVTVFIAPAPPVPANLTADLARLRGNNGNGDLFEIFAINGFDESSKNQHDDGRVNYEAMNGWFREQGFAETTLSKFKNRPIHLFEKTLRRSDGSELRVQVTRLLAETDLDQSRNVSFAKFLKKGLETADVVIYEGHSGLGVNLDLEAIEQQLLLSKDKKVGEHIEFNRSKHQLFFFDSCSSYSYYLGMFAGRKDKGTLAVLTNGLASLFGFEVPMTKHLYRQLINVNNDNQNWSDFLEDLEIPLRGNTFQLNVDVNN